MWWAAFSSPVRASPLYISTVEFRAGRDLAPSCWFSMLFSEAHRSLVSELVGSRFKCGSFSFLKSYSRYTNSSAVTLFQDQKITSFPVVLMPCQVFKQLGSWDGPSDNIPLFQSTLEAVWSPQEIHVTGPSTHLWFSSGGSLPECIFGDIFAGRLTRVTFQQARWPLELGFPEVLEESLKVL